MTEKLSMNKFQEELEKRVLKELGKEYEVRRETIKKVNVIYNGITFIKTSGQSISPTLYPEQLYELYANGGTFDGIVKRVVELVLKRWEGESEINLLENFDENRVIPVLVNKSLNIDLLSGVPHRDFCDLSLMYKYAVSQDKDEVASTIITDNLAKKWKLDEEMLFNIVKSGPNAVFKKLSDFVKNLLPKSTGDENLDFMEGMEDPGLYVVTSKDMRYGASEVFVHEELRQAISKQLGGDFFILPSSIHETLIMGDGYMSGEELRQMVTSVNRESVTKEEFLSDNVYKYSCVTGEIEIA